MYTYLIVRSMAAQAAAALIGFWLGQELTWRGIERRFGGKKKDSDDNTADIEEEATGRWFIESQEVYSSIATNYHIEPEWQGESWYDTNFPISFGGTKDNIQSHGTILRFARPR